MGQVLRPNTGKAFGDAQRPVHAVNGVNKCLGLLRPTPCRAQTQHIRQLRQTLAGRRAVCLQHHRQQYGVGPAMGHIVQPAQGVSQGVYIAHAGPGEGKARPVGGRQQLLSGPKIGSVGTGGWEILKNGLHRLPGKASGLPGVIKAADVGLHRMGQGVQAGLRRDTGRQGYRQRRVQNGPPGNQTQIIHRILVVGLVRNHGGDGGLRPGPGCGGHRRKGDDFSADLQKPLQLPHRAVGPGQPGRCGLGCVHGTAPADGHHAVAPLRPELGHDLLHRLNFRVGRDAVEAAPGWELFRHGNKFRCGALAAAYHDHGLFAPGVRQQLRQPLQAPGPGDAFRPAPGQYPGPQAEAGLKHPTVYFFKQHKAHILSMGYYAAF